MVADQVGAPTSTELLADVTVKLLEAMSAAADNDARWGVYHVAAACEVSWHGYAQHVIGTAKRMRPELAWQVTEVAPVATSAFPTPAARPLNSRLCTNKLQQVFGLVLPPWQQGVDRMLAEIL